MKKAIVIILAAALMVALPFIFKPEPETTVWREGDPELVVITPHNESIRYEFGAAFTKWHAEKYGRPARIDWRVIGGTTEIMRYLVSEYIGSMEGWCGRQGRPFPSSAGSAMLNSRFGESADDGAPAFAERLRIFNDFRTNDAPEMATSRIDVFFGGGTYDHGKAEEQGLTVPPWPKGEIPPGFVADAEGRELIPVELSGDTWRSDCFFGTVLSTFGICWNPDRLKDIGVDHDPVRWADLAAPEYFGQVGVTDPTKSGSVAKAFEMIVQQVMADYIRDLGYADADIRGFSAVTPATADGNDPETGKYVRDVSAAWTEGMNLVRLIGANAKYFTDGAGKVPIDVGMGAIAAGIAIDFFGRFQAEYTRTPDGKTHMDYVTPKGGSCVSADPVSLLRGAPHRDLAVRFIEFVLSEEGQTLWNARPGTEGGTEKYALRRLPIRRDFYPSEIPEFDAVCRRHLKDMSDDLSSPSVNPFKLAEDFTYRAQWSARHFGIQRDLIRAMCLDSGDELRAAWKAVLDNGGPEANPEAMELIRRLPTKPVPVTWKSAVTDYRRVPRLEYMRIWTAEMRDNYNAAARLARGRGK